MFRITLPQNWGCGKVLVGKPEEKGPFGRRRRRWEDDIKTHLQEVGAGGIDWIDLAQDRDRWEGCCECGNEPLGCRKGR